MQKGAQLRDRRPKRRRLRSRKRNDPRNSDIAQEVERVGIVQNNGFGLVAGMAVVHVTAFGSLNCSKFLHRETIGAKNRITFDCCAIAVLHLGIRARFEGRHVVKEGCGKEHVAIDVQAVLLS